MLWFERLNKIQGFDINDPANARQNSYAWSMVEFGDYIYIGTCRNMLISAATSFSGQLNQNPIITTGIDNNAEIWRYKRMEAVHGNESLRLILPIIVMDFER